jgi:hypothetical protein
MPAGVKCLTFMTCEEIPILCTPVQSSHHIIKQLILWINVCIIVYVKSGRIIMGTYKLLRSAFGEEIPSHIRMFGYFLQFIRGRISVKYDPYFGHPSLLHTEGTTIHVCDKICDDRNQQFQKWQQKLSLHIVHARLRYFIVWESLFVTLG